MSACRRHSCNDRHRPCQPESPSLALRPCGQPVTLFWCQKPGFRGGSVDVAAIRGNLLDNRWGFEPFRRSVPVRAFIFSRLLSVGAACATASVAGAAPFEVGADVVISQLWEFEQFGRVGNIAGFMGDTT